MRNRRGIQPKARNRSKGIAGWLRLAGVIGFLGTGAALKAQNGSWNVDASGNWGAASDWVSSTIANGAGNRATFDLSGMSVAPTVTLDSPRTIGNLVFGNPGGYDGQNWALAGSSVLTLSSGSVPTITCWPLLSAGNSACTISAPLSGLQGFTKQGSGTLWLAGNNAGLSGTLTIAAGRVFNYNANGLGSLNVAIANGSYPKTASP